MIARRNQRPPLVCEFGTSRSLGAGNDRWEQSAVNDDISARRAEGSQLAPMPPIRHKSRKSPTTANGRRSRAVTQSVLADLDRARHDAGVSLRRLAAASSVSEPYLNEMFAGDREPSISVLTAVSRALGGNLSVRFYPNAGPVIHDRIQARIVEELLRIAAPTWSRNVEVPVLRPARGFIDVVFDLRTLATTVATEVETRIDRLEQQLRWAREKAASLPSSDPLGSTRRATAPSTVYSSFVPPTPLASSRDCSKTRCAPRTRPALARSTSP